MMATRYYSAALLSVLLLFLLFAACGDDNKTTTGGTSDPDIIANHQVIDDFENIPTAIIDSVKASFKIFYGHTSHGSQIITGMNIVRDENLSLDFNNGAGTLQIAEYGDDLGHLGDTSWVAPTRERLNQSSYGYNVVVWSWCGGCSDNTEEGINVYLQAMSALEADYPEVKFIYMTGHLDGTGPDGNLYQRNNQIRAFCRASNKLLFDFADIESYDPEGNYYPDASDVCEWCADYYAQHPCPECPSCAHSHCYNCYLKGKAFWWLLARMAGWSG
ncbi:MAG: hypothetical protein HRF51_01205 [bacterium]